MTSLVEDAKMAAAAPAAKPASASKELPMLSLQANLCPKNNRKKAKTWERFLFKPSSPPATENWATLLTERVHKDLFTDTIITLIDMMVPLQAATELAEKSSSFTSETAQQAVAELNKVIAYCNAELDAFGAQLTSNTILDIHALMCQLLISANLKFHSSKLNKLVTDFEAKRSGYEANFMAQTYQGSDMDAHSIYLLAREFEDNVLAECLPAAKILFSQKVVIFAQTTVRTALQASVEARLVTSTLEEQVAYVKDPAETLEQECEQRWRVYWQEIKGSLSNIYKEVADSVQKLSDWVASVVAGLKLHGSHEFFEAPPGTTTSLNDKRIVTVQLIKDLLKKSLKAEYNSVRVTLKLLPPLRQITPVGIPPCLKLPTPKGSELLELLLNRFNSVKCISNIIDFTVQLQDALSLIATRIATTCPTINELDPDHLLARAKSKAIGCTEKCPCCWRCCNVPHWRIAAVTIGEGDNRHKCTNGHQYRGMAGYSLKDSRWASLRTCCGIQDNDKLEIEGKLTSWAAFKEANTSWDFSQDTNQTSDQILNNCAWNVAQWQRIGPAICEEYHPNF